MFESISTFIKGFIGGSADRGILVALVILISLFFLITIALFLVTVYLRISNYYKEVRTKYRSKTWDPLILSVMDGTLEPHRAFDQMKWKNSIDYLLRLELYIDMIKGEEKGRLLALGRLSSNRLQSLLQSANRKNRLYGVHLLGIFDPEDQYQYLRFNGRDFEMTLTMIREMRTVKDFRLKEKLINFLFIFKYISPIYVSNILVDMGEEIIPILRMLILDRVEQPYEQVVAIETIRRMHYSGCLDLADTVLKGNDHPLVLTSFLRYMEEMSGQDQIELVKPFLDHPHSQVRMAAVDAYLAISETLTSEDISRFFNDPVVQVAVSAAEKLNLMDTVPFFEMEEIDQFKWADIYKRMVY